MKVLLGHSGFVGGNLQRQQPFDAVYNRSNIAQFCHQHVDELFIAAAPGFKWLANQQPDMDLAAITALINVLRTVQAQRVVLISTVDVYPQPVNVTESTPIDRTEQHPYGRHRLALEDFIHTQFANSLTIRLPGLFGHGLKKNIIYDCLHRHEIDKINPQAQFQFYAMTHLSADINIAQTAGLRLLNLSTEPVNAAQVSHICLGHALPQTGSGTAAIYDFRSEHATLFNGQNGYCYPQTAVLADLRAYVTQFNLTAR